jgi:hypothetical protein
MPQTIYLLKTDSDGTMRSIPREIGIALTSESEAELFKDRGACGYVNTYSKVLVYNTLEDAGIKLKE